MQNDTQPSQPDTNSHQPAAVELAPASSSKLGKRIGLIFAGVLLFVFGLFVGQGRISFTSIGSGDTAKSSKLDYSELDALYNSLVKNYNGTLTSDQIMDGLKHGMAESAGDPYTVYMSAKESEDFNGSLQGTISGIGAKLEQDEDKNVVVAAPLAGSPAEAAGLRAKDIITSVDKKSVAGMSVSEVVKRIRGEKGTKVTVSIIRDKSESLTFTITRDTIKIPSVVTKTLSDGQIGYIQVSQFSDDTDELIEKAADTFQSQGIKKVVLDLRDNPGGEVTTAVNLSSLWLKSGDTIVQQRKGSKVVDTQYATSLNTFRGVQTVVLINAGSASASEITALALRDYKAATIIGEQSYGKGVVQQLISFGDGSALKVTVAKWYSPNGTNIDKKGITPDRVVKYTEDDYKNGTDPQLDAATAYLLK